MYSQHRRNWQKHVRNVVRSRHYGWLAEARDGDPIPEVLKDVTADVMHICKVQGISWEQLMEQSRRQYEVEEREAANVG